MSEKDKSAVLDENGDSSLTNHQQERDDMGKDQPMFLVVRAVRKTRQSRARHQRCNQRNDLGKKLACLFHGIELGCTDQGTGLRMINTVRLGRSKYFTGRCLQPVASARLNSRSVPSRIMMPKAVLIPRKLASAPIITGPINCRHIPWLPPPARPLPAGHDR